MRFNHFSEKFWGYQLASLRPRIVAGDTFRLISETSMESNSSAETDGGGFISSSDAEARADFTGTTSVVVGSNANITADTSKIDLDIDSNAFAGGLFGHAEADSYSDITSNSIALVEGSSSTDTRITGYEGVDIRALNGGVIDGLHSDATFIGIGDSPENDHRNFHFTAYTDADRGVTVIVGVRDDNRDGETGLEDGQANRSLNNLTLFGEAHNSLSGVDDVGDDRRAADIRWDADVIALAGIEGTPELVVDANGNVVRAKNVKINGGGSVPTAGTPVDPDNDGKYSINDIINNNFGDVLFRWTTPSRTRRRRSPAPPTTSGRCSTSATPSSASPSSTTRTRRCMST